VAEFLAEYLSRSFTEIYVIDHEEREETGGFETQHTYQTVVAKSGDKYYEVGLHEQNRFGPRGGPRISVMSTEISSETYEQRRTGKERPTIQKL
jgi:hypothetical protein